MAPGAISPTDWDDLRVLLAVAEEGSFLAASQALWMVTSTVSRRVGALEARAGTHLVERRADGAHLTDAGRALCAVAQGFAQQLQVAWRDLSPGDGTLQGVVRVSIGDGFAELLTDVAQRFKCQHPAVRLEIAVESRVVSVASREADLAIRTVDRQEPALIYRRLGTLRYGLWASEAYVAQAGMPRDEADMSTHDGIGFEGPLAAFPATRWLASMGIKRWSVLSAAHTVHVAAARAGLGVAALPDVSVQGLVRLLPKLAGPQVPVHMVSDREALRRPHVRAFADALVAHVRAKLAQPLLG